MSYFPFGKSKSPASFGANVRMARDNSLSGRQHKRSLWAAFKRYRVVLTALIRREEQARRASLMDAIVNFVEPVLLIAVMTIALRFLHGNSAAPLGDNPILFYASGVYPNYFFMHLSRAMPRSVGRLGRRFPVEQRLDTVIVYILRSIWDYVVLGILLFGTIYLFFSSQAAPYDLTSVFEAALAIVLLGFGWGMLNLIMGELSALWRLLFPPLNRVLVLFSGLLFIADFLPPTTRYVLSFNPMLHAICLFRLGFYPNQPTLVLDKAYLAAWAVIAVLFGLMLERNTRRKEE